MDLNTQKYWLLQAALCALLFGACSRPNQNDKPGKMALPELPAMPRWAANAVLYEVNVRQFSPEGNLNGVTQALPELKKLGVDIVWLMPVFPIGELKRKGSLGSPYSVRDYQAIHPDLGTINDLKLLVSKSHELGMKVILDWVPNHTAWDHVWMKTHPEYYTRLNGNFTVPLNEHGAPIDDWSDIADLDFGNPDLRKAMISSMHFWIETCKIDGFRVDMAGLVPNAFWIEAGNAFRSQKDLFLLSEWQDEPEHFNSFFQVNYGWKFKDVTRDIWSGKKSAMALDSLKTELDGFYPNHYIQLYFTQNHDENSWAGTESELYGASADLFNILAFTWQGIPMLYNGQEVGLSKRLPFFEKETIDWSDHSRKLFFEKLCALRRQNPALGSGLYGGPIVKIPTNNDQAVYAFTREKGGNRVIVVLNMSKSPQTVRLDVPQEAIGAYTSVFSASTITLEQNMQLSLKPWDYLVLTR